MPQPAPATAESWRIAPNGPGTPATFGAVVPPAGQCLPAVNRLTITAFRNHRQSRLDLSGGMVVLTGPNGAGKTNVIEALSFLAPGRGLRRCKLSEIDHRDAGLAWAVSAELTGAAGSVRIGTGRAGDTDPARRENGTERRLLRIDGAPVRSLRTLADHLAVVWLSPEHDRLFADGASVRRRFLDRLVVAYDAEHVGRVAAYDHALRERSRLLRAPGADVHWLDALEQKLAATGIAIVHARHHLIERLSIALSEGVGPFIAPVIGVSGELERWLETGPALVAEDRMRAVLAADRKRDVTHGGARIGPHRSDLVALQPDNGVAARQCSTGEQKAMVIAIVLAHTRMIAADRGAPPLLLLDEVAAHLDSDRRAALFDELSALNVQAWMTGADRALFAALGDRADIFTVLDGSVQDGRATAP